MPDFLSQVKEALASSPVAPVAGPSQVPTIPVAASGPSSAPPIISGGPPPIVVEDSGDSDPGVQTLAVPFRAGSSDTYLPMISTDDSWSSDAEFRYFLLPPFFVFRYR